MDQRKRIASMVDTMEDMELELAETFCRLILERRGSPWGLLPLMLMMLPPTKEQ
jgi:hypothetical protein